MTKTTFYEPTEIERPTQTLVFTKTAGRTVALCNKIVTLCNT